MVSGGAPCTKWCLWLLLPSVCPWPACASPVPLTLEASHEAKSWLEHGRAQYTPYGQTGHYKSYAPDEYYDEGGETSDEPYIDCSGLVQKAWQIPDQIYPGQWNPPSVPAVEYPAASFTSNGSYWTVIAQGALATGDALSTSEHTILWVMNSGDWKIIDASGTMGKVLYRTWPAGYNKADYTAARRSEVSSGLNEIILDNPTAKQTGGSITYTVNGHTCPCFFDWSKSSQMPDRYGIDYQHQWGTGTGTEKKVRWTPRFFHSGSASYHIYIKFPSNSTYATGAKVIVKDNTDYDSVHYVNQTQGVTWYYLGTKTFDMGYSTTNGTIILTTYGTPTNQHVIADAVRFVKQ